ncbi:hypothetical protein [uncultured Methanobrevibacter sp.]|uniref:hypothetical protein n=1 Tax=uncultured Methanobrevibacter sp. TaxID=253161 RepID=UPI0025F41F69|nr:hypothetical protein [uncultured Methanobrevibacter sp.]
MILKELLDYFNIDVDLPKYLYEESFNEVFLKGELSKTNNTYKIVIETRKDVIHTMIIDPGDDYPVVISSILPNGKTNGIKFGRISGDLIYI